MICLAVNKYSDTVFRIAFSVARSSADAEDITQETFLALMSKKPQLTDETHLKSWLLRVAVNKCKNLMKSAPKRKTAALEAAAYKFNLNDGDIGVIDCVNKLPPLERHIVLLHYIEGYSAKETGVILGKTENAIFTRLSRIRAKLKDLLEEIEP